MSRDRFRSVGAILGIGVGLTLMVAVGPGGVIGGAIYGAGGALAGGILGERVHSIRHGK